MDPIRVVAFDLDGTLVDSAPDITHALNSALRLENLLKSDAGFGVDTVRGWVGDGPDALIARALAFLRARDRTMASIDPTALRPAFDAVTLAAPLSHGFVYPGLASALEELQRMCPLVVVTNKPRALACAVLDAGKLSTYFTAVYGADRHQDRKPAPAMLLQAAHALGLLPGELLMVGDAPPDMGAARAAGAHAVWVAWGYGQADPPTDVLCIDRPQQLVSLVRKATQGGLHAHRR
jgi:phosphoglycolate phosphatase